MTGQHNTNRTQTSMNAFRVMAEEYDEADVLAAFRSEFVIVDPGLIYMDGNSLGRLPKKSALRASQIVSEEWGRQLIRSWGINWFEAPRTVGAKIATLVGAGGEEVIVSDSTTANLYKVVMAALKMQPGRTKIVTDEFNFPSDIYILQGCSQLFDRKFQIEMVHSADGISIAENDIEQVLDDNTAVLLLSHVVFKSGYMYDAARIIEIAHRKGVIVIWDLSHSVGSVPVDLDKWGADYAIGCTYKYLNGGPGSPAFLYVNKSIQSKAVSPIWGWFGDKNPFSFDLEYQPAAGINRFLAGTPGILSMLTMEPGVDLILAAGMDRLREKSVKQTEYLIQLFDAALAPLGFTLGTPRDPSRRGSHVSIRHPEGYRINQALINDMQVIPDFREPDNIRLGIAPIYTTFVDIWEAVDRIVRLMQQETFKKYSPSRQVVT